jgi:hypothetical protein
MARGWVMMMDTLNSDAKFWGGIARIAKYFQQIIRKIKRMRGGIESSQTIM